MKGYVAARTRYYKYDAAIAVLDHASILRNGFTRSSNVIERLSFNNASYYFNGATSCLDAFHAMRERYRQITGKKCRSDFNALFEHIIIFTESKYSELEKKHGAEKVKNAILLQLRRYAEEIKKEYGFEPLGIDFHLDEGTENPITGEVRRNIHAHVQFFNYDIEKKVAPLRHLMKKGRDINGRTNELNPNFVRMQDIAAGLFEKAGFHRGVSKSITSAEHQKKEKFVKSKLARLQHEAIRLKQISNDLNQSIKARITPVFEAMKKFLTNEEVEGDEMRQAYAKLSKTEKTLVEPIIERARKSYKERNRVRSYRGAVRR